MGLEKSREPSSRNDTLRKELTKDNKQQYVHCTTIVVCIFLLVVQSPISARRATSLADRLRVGIAVIHGESKDDERDDDDGRASPPPNEEQVNGLE